MSTKELHLVAFYNARPKNPRMTHIKGYMTNPENISYDERIEFTRGLKKNGQSTGGVILNLNKKQVVRNRFGNDKSFDDLFKYFLEAYPQYVVQVMAQLDMEYLEQFIPKEEEQPTEEAKADEEAKAE